MIEKSNKNIAPKVTVLSVVLLLGFGAVPLDAQVTRAVDLRNQPVPILNEQIEASNMRTFPSDGTQADKSLPLKITVQSIGRVSKVNPKTVVEITIQNIGKNLFYLPVSRELKVIHYDGNVDRRKFFCSVVLEPQVVHPFLSGMLTYSSSNDPSSRVPLPSGESLQLTFEVNLEGIWKEDFAKWYGNLADGTDLLTVQCNQEILTPITDTTNLPEPLKGERVYRSVISHSVRSANAVPLMQQ